MDLMGNRGDSSLMLPRRVNRACASLRPLLKAPFLAEPNSARDSRRRREIAP